VSAALDAFHAGEDLIGDSARLVPQQLGEVEPPG
jgi:hypothetical protein